MIFFMRWIFVVLFLVTVAVCPVYAYSDWNPLIKRLVADHFDEKTIQALFSQPNVRFDPDVMSSKLKEVINNRSAKTGTTPVGKTKAVYDGFLKPAKIDSARSYTRANMPTLKEIEKKYCVQPEIIVAILLVETDLEGFLGRKNAFNTLASMALSTNLETIRPYLSPDLITRDNEYFAETICRKKSKWAYSELKALISYASERGINPLSIPGSIYGAIGICQFMPSKIPVYGIDADKDGHIDVFSRQDALYSVANYLRRNGWKCNMTSARKHKMIMAYNHSNTYANTILKVAEKIRQ